MNARTISSRASLRHTLKARLRENSGQVSPTGNKHACRTKSSFKESFRCGTNVMVNNEYSILNTVEHYTPANDTTIRGGVVLL